MKLLFKDSINVLLTAFSLIKYSRKPDLAIGLLTALAECWKPWLTCSNLVSWAWCAYIG